MKSAAKYVLGLDLGVASIGWAVIELDKSGVPISILRSGVHLFESGTKGDVASGRDESRAGPRRMARSMRRGYWRRTRRKRKLLRLLQELGLLPPLELDQSVSPTAGEKVEKYEANESGSGAIDHESVKQALRRVTRRKRGWPRVRALSECARVATLHGFDGRASAANAAEAMERINPRRGAEVSGFNSASIDALIKSLDAELSSRLDLTADHRERQLLPYRLRAQGLTRRLEPFELGRAIYHLAQRRGYWSNRRTEGADTEDERKGEVYTGIKELENLMEAAGAQTTLGDFFASLNPVDPVTRRIRGRWTARSMYKGEFERIWSEQSKHHAALTKDAHDRIHNAIFFQRPLKPRKVGLCELEKGEKRARAGLRASQQFRILQHVNNIEVLFHDHTKRRLTPEERGQSIDALNRCVEMRYTTLRKHLGLPKGAVLNFEEEGEKDMWGHRTDAGLRAIFGERFDTMSEEEKDAVVDDLISYETAEGLAKRGRDKWGLDKQGAKALGEFQLESGHTSHSAVAMRKLITRMQDGTRYMTARIAEYGERLGKDEPLDLLPGVDKVLGDLRNPGVTRALTELRKVVNAIVRRFGKPTVVRIELAREMKKSRKHRREMAQEMRDRRGMRQSASKRLDIERNIKQPKRSDIERVLLAEECGWVCPYTGRAFGMEDLIGPHPKLDVEHIWPVSRSLDDSFLNKTLCWHEENRTRKRNLTPHEAYSGVAKRWSQIIDRVKRFHGDAGWIKLERFEASAIPDGFVNRHLNETRSISAKASEYLEALFGGRDDAAGRRRVQVTTGGLTAHLRREWMLDSILSFKDEKNRADHRHHAVDAIIVALTDTRSVQMLQRAAEEASAAKRRLFAPVDSPWKAFLDEARASVEAINVSYRQNRRVSGKLHAETLYSREIASGQGGKTERRVRKELHKLTVGDVERIADPAIRKLVKAKLAALKLDPAKAFIEPKNHPHIKTKAGGIVPIHKVRVVVQEKPIRIGSGARERFVASTAGSNHHTTIIASKTFTGSGKAKTTKTVWADQPVTLMEAHRRKGSGQLIVDRSVRGTEHGEFVYSLAVNEFVMMTDEGGQERLYRVQNISEGDIGLVLHIDGRTADQRKKAKDRIRTGGPGLLARGAKKVAVTYLGEIQNAGG